MNKKAVLLFILNVMFSTAESFGRFKRSNTECEYSSLTKGYISVSWGAHVQPLNHFSSDDKRQWLQKYAVSANYYKKGGPAFLFLRGSRPMDEGYEFSSYVLIYARHLNAICFTIENRFYGRTPPSNESDLRDLSTAQILADVANFVRSMPKKFHLPADIKWVVFGCSYGGSMAAKVRRAYPHLIFGAVASSAPLLAKVDYYEYEQILGESLRSYDSQCEESITTAFKEIAYPLITWQKVKKIIQMFEYLDDDLLNDILMMRILIVQVSLMVINDAVLHNNLRTKVVNISSFCRTMIQYNGTKLEALAEITKMYMEQERGKMMIPTGKIFEDQNSKKNEDERIADAWAYQRCSEYGYFTSYTNTPFLSPVKHLLRTIELDIKIQCRKFFGPNVEDLAAKVDLTNSLYGGLSYNVSNTIFINGSLDPFYKGGIYKTSNNSLYKTIFIKGTSHCADTFPSSAEDIPELRNARNEVLRTLKTWLEEDPFRQL